MTGTHTTCAKIRLGFKCVQLVLSCVCIGLYANTGIGHVSAHTSMGHVSEATLMSITFGGYIIILSGLILGFFTGDRCPKKVDLLYTLLGLALFVASGSIAIAGFNKLKPYEHDPHIDQKLLKKTINVGLAMGSIAVINGACFLFDAVLSYKDVSEYTPHQ